MTPTRDLVEALVAAVEASDREAELMTKAASRNTTDHMEAMALLPYQRTHAAALRKRALDLAMGWRS